MVAFLPGHMEWDQLSTASRTSLLHRVRCARILGWCGNLGVPMVPVQVARLMAEYQHRSEGVATYCHGHSYMGQRVVGPISKVLVWQWSSCCDSQHRLVSGQAPNAPDVIPVLLCSLLPMLRFGSPHRGCGKLQGRHIVEGQTIFSLPSHRPAPPLLQSHNSCWNWCWTPACHVRTSPQKWLVPRTEIFGPPRKQCTAAACGIPDATIKMLGRWQSLAYSLYIRTPRVQLASIASRLAAV